MVRGPFAVPRLRGEGGSESLLAETGTGAAAAPRWQQPPRPRSPTRRERKPFVVAPPESRGGLGLPPAIWPAGHRGGVRHQMFAEGPRDRCASSLHRNQRKLPFPSINLSFPWFDLSPDSSSPAACWFCWVFPSVQTQIMAPAAPGRGEQDAAGIPAQHLPERDTARGSKRRLL